MDNEEMPTSEEVIAAMDVFYRLARQRGDASSLALLRDGSPIGFFVTMTARATKTVDDALESIATGTEWRGKVKDISPASGGEEC